MLRVSPAGLAAAPVPNQLPLQITIQEELCCPICITSSVQPQATLTYQVGTAQFNGDTVFVPITAVFSILTGSGCDTRPENFTEQFYVAFQGQTGLPQAVDIVPAGRIQNPSDVECGLAYAYSVNDSVRVVLTPAAAAAAAAD